MLLLSCCSPSQTRGSAALFLVLLLLVFVRSSIGGWLPSRRPTSTSDSLWTALNNRFQGDFDNYRQVVQDRQHDLYPGPSGGHENIHCTLIPVDDVFQQDKTTHPSAARLACYYFDGNPNAIFRFRYYRLVPVQEHEGEEAVDTILYTISRDIEVSLRATSNNPLQWAIIWRQHLRPDMVSLLNNCTVRWTRTADPVLHAYALQIHDGSALHASMMQDHAILPSQSNASQLLLIRDQLSLWDNSLWIHDRGVDAVTGEWVYGNHANVPYQLDRVASIDDKKSRIIVDHDLGWTLGQDYRTPEIYQEKLQAMKGPSVSRRQV